MRLQRMMQAGVVTAALVTVSVAGAQPMFGASDGKVIMEVESAPIGGANWAEESSLGGGSGTYYRYLGNNICSGPAQAADALDYTFRIYEAGTYELKFFMARIWHCTEGTRHDASNHVCLEGKNPDTGKKYFRGCEFKAEPAGDQCPDPWCLRKDLSNDVFVEILDGDSAYVEYDDQHQSNLGPTKLFGGGQNEFKWSGGNSLDSGGKRAPKWTLSPGDYTLRVYGRSQGCRIDKILFSTDGKTNDIVTAAETIFDGTPLPGGGSGGASSGGATSGGATSGGMNAGGSDSGGSSSGGVTGTGGSNAGGTSTGGTDGASGGTTSGGTTSGGMGGDSASAGGTPGASSGDGATGAGASPSGADGDGSEDSGSGDSGSGNAATSDDGGCAVSGNGPSTLVSLGLLALAGFLLRRRHA